MKQKTTLRQATLWILTPLIFVACKKNTDNPDNNQAEAVKLSVGSTVSKAAYDDVFDLILQDGENNNLGGRSSSQRTSSCATITIDPATPGVFPKTMTIDFGAGCTGPYGIVRKGKVIAVLSNRIHLAGTTIAVTFDNYYVNNYKVEGNFSVTNNGGTGLNFTTQTTNGKLTYPDGTTYFNYNGTHTFTQTAGSGTPTFIDDSFTITGNSVTTSSVGNSLTVSISTPLVKNSSCHNVSAGVQQFTYNSISGSLNYGDGTCDNLALITIGAFSQIISLPYS